MSIGTGIFLSSLVIGLVALYGLTKDRWRWRRIASRSIAGLVIIAALAGSLGYAIYEYQNRPRPAGELWGLTLGASAADVRFLKGSPTEETAGSWTYKQGVGRGEYVVGFTDGKVSIVFFQGDRLNAPTVASVSPFSNWPTILSKLGEPSRFAEFSDGLTRLYYFDTYRVVFGLSKGQINMVGVYQPTEGGIKLNYRSAPD